MTRSRVVVAALAMATAVLAAAGCGAGGPPQRSRAAVVVHAGRSMTARPGGTRPGGTRPGGAMCPRVLSPGRVSIGDLASAPVMTAVAHTRVLTELMRAIRTAGLVRRLDAAKTITLFAPDDSAFAALGRGNLATLLASKSDLAKVVQYHIVTGRYTPADLASGKHLTTLRGTVIVPAESRGKYRVNNAIVCGSIQTANATVYIVNEVLVPVP